jgi:hypothetical protein
MGPRSWIWNPGMQITKEVNRIQVRQGTLNRREHHRQQNKAQFPYRICAFLRPKDRVEPARNDLVLSCDPCDTCDTHLVALDNLQNRVQAPTWSGIRIRPTQPTKLNPPCFDVTAVTVSHPVTTNQERSTAMIDTS